MARRRDESPAIRTRSLHRRRIHHPETSLAPLPWPGSKSLLCPRVGSELDLLPLLCSVTSVCGLSSCPFKLPNSSFGTAAMSPGSEHEAS